MNPREPSGGLPSATLATLMLAAFVVSIGYSVALPQLPYLVERLLGAAAEPAQVARHTGLLTAAYALSIFLFAPLWGRLSDRCGPRGVLLAGLIGFGATFLVFALAGKLVVVYAGGFLSGLFAAAVAPVATAVVGTFTATGPGRARRLAFVGMAGIAGFLLGPMLGVAASSLSADLLNLTLPAGSIAIPFAATALLALFVACAVALTVPGGTGPGRPRESKAAAADVASGLMPKLLMLTFIVSAGIGVFEVGLALRGKQELGLSPYQIALMFTECSLVMFLAQAIAFSPRFNPATTRWLIAPGFAVLAAGLLLVPQASAFPWMLAVIGAVAASAGILSPILTYWISTHAGSALGWQLGKQAAAASLGVSVGSAAGGLLFNVAALPGTAFVLAGALAVLGALLSRGLPHVLVPPNPGDGALASQAP